MARDNDRIGIAAIPEPGAPSLPWLAGPLEQALATHRGHALLVHAAPGLGAREHAMALAQAWLCESVAAQTRRPCGRCGSCRLVHSRVHPDLTVLMPETLRRDHGWPLVSDKPEGEEARRKPSRQIRIEEVRAVLAWAQMTSARGRGKVAVLHPAEALNRQSANALLKTLEEPPPGTRLLLTCTDPALLLPTVVSRCQVQRLPVPPQAQAIEWLQSQGLAAATDAATLLAACSGRPLDALGLVREGVDAAAWRALPAAVARGDATALAGWPLPRALDALQKICHDALAATGGGAPHYFAGVAVGAGARPAALAAWSHELTRVVRYDEHPWHEALLIEALVQGGAAALALPPGGSPRRGGRGLATLPA